MLLPIPCFLPTRFSPTTKSWGTPPWGLLGPRPDDQRRPLGLLVRLLLAARPSSLGGTGREELKPCFSRLSTDASSNRASGIANRRFLPDLQGKPSEAVVEELARTDEGYKHASKYLTVAGGFNVNSTSQRAWEATLLGLKKRRILYSRSGRPSVLNNSQTSFSRFGVASSDKSHVDDYGSIGVTQGIPDGEAMAWSDLRTLSDTQIRSLAQNMVKEVKKRGPFLNMSDFVNRRLQSGEMGVKGRCRRPLTKAPSTARLTNSPTW